MNFFRQKLHGFEYPPGERLIVKFNSELKHLPLQEGLSGKLSPSQRSQTIHSCIHYIVYFV